MKIRFGGWLGRDTYYLNPREVLYVVAIIVLGIVAVFLARYNTPYGMGLVNDSAAYIGGARNILAGHGYSRLVGDGSYEPYTHFPPLFSIVLACVSSFGLETIRASRLVVLALFGLNTMMIGLLIRRLTHHRVAAIFGAIFFLISEPFLRVHSFSLSEPLYIFISLITLYLLIEYSSNKQWNMLVGAGIFSSLAYLTRYVGATFYLVAFLVISITSGSWRKWMKDGLIYAASSLPLIIAWTMRGLIVSENSTNRVFLWHPVEQDTIQQGLKRFFGWLLPEFGGILEKYYPLWLIIFLGLSLGLLIILVSLIRTSKRSKGEELDRQISVSILIIHAFVYLGIVIASMTFFDDSTRFEHRILAPFTLSILILMVCGLVWLWKRPGKLTKLLVPVLCIGLFSFVIEDTVDTVKYLHVTPQGFASGRWTNSEVLEVLKTLPADIKIFSNEITATYLIANRATLIIPWMQNPVTGKIEKSYMKSVELDRQQVLDGTALIIIFDYNHLIESNDKVILDLTHDLPIYMECEDGVIFGIR